MPGSYSGNADAAATLTKPETKKSVFGGWYEDDGATLALQAFYFVFHGKACAHVRAYYTI